MNLTLKSLGGTLFLMGALIAPDIQASYPSGYYDSLEGKCGADLMHAIKAICIDHTEISYSGGTWDAFKLTDVRTVNGVEYWWDMYSPDLVTVSSGHPGLNVEHSVANSWWGGTKNAAYKDIVHLNPSNETANSRKSNYPICELSSINWTNGVTSVGGPKSGQGGGSSWGYEPCDEYKGDFARVFMYMFSVYEDLNWTKTWMIDKSSGTMFAAWARDLVMRWSAADPVSEKERNRNDGIYIKQNNRNPFIDLPDLADHIWGELKDVPFSLGDTPPVTPPDPGTVNEYNWLSADSPTIDEGWDFIDTNLPAEASYIWSWKSYNSNYYLNGSAHIGGSPYRAESYAFGPAVNMDNVAEATLSFDHAAKFQTTCRQECTVAVMDNATGEITKFQVPAWPSPGSWAFTPSGEMDLSGFADKEIRIGFRYGSTDSGADTWEINNMHLLLKLRQAGVELQPEETDESVFVEVWGNTVLAPEGCAVYDMRGRLTGNTNLERGLYIVVGPKLPKAIKVMVK